ncbi:MAG: hypothetical protein LWX56_02800 [Ignavibacteria bacterium]|nr:hypothetical protein [Ignavibacteria bacterium]
MKKYLFLVVSLFIVLVTGCKEDKTVMPVSDGSNQNPGGDTLYIPVSPSWGGFNNPQAILMGREPFIYICDTDNNRVVMMNTAGTVLSVLSNIKKPTAITQDYLLNLYIIAQFDTLGQTYSSVYRVNLLDANYSLEAATPIRLLPRGADFQRSKRQYKALTAFYNNAIYIARSGPDNSNVADYDNCIMAYVKVKRANGYYDDSLAGTRPTIDPLSTGLISANGISCMTSFSGNKYRSDFITTFIGDNSFKAQWFHWVETSLEAKYTSQFDPSKNMVKFVKPNRFGNPTGVCLDPSGNIYVADPDASKDSVFKFNSFGEELQSFGGVKVFKKPVGVAYFDRTLYVLDAGLNQILRFKLSTDLQ